MKILFILLIVIIWAGAIILQRKKRYPVAERILQEKVKELTADFGKLEKKVCQDYTHEKKVVDGITYYIGYFVERPKEITDRNFPGELVDSLRLAIYVDCVTIIPFIYCKLGPSHEETVEKIFESNKN